MKKETIDGVDYYVFDQDEKGIKQSFDKLVDSPNMVKDLMMVLIDATYELENKKNEAWQAMRRRLKKEFPDLPDKFDIGYDSTNGSFEILKKP